MPEYERLVLKRDGNVNQLENFNNYNILSFATLCDNTEKKAEELVEITENVESTPANV